jgi:hypothetical protein
LFGNDQKLVSAGAGLAALGLNRQRYCDVIGLSRTLAEVFYAFQNSLEAFLERAALDFLRSE